MKKVFAILLAAMLTVGLSFCVFADFNFTTPEQALSQMYAEVPFSNWKGVYVYQSVSGSNLTIDGSGQLDGGLLQTRKYFQYPRGSSTNVFSLTGSEFVVDSSLFSGGSFNFQFVYSMHASSTNPGSAWVCVCEDSYLLTVLSDILLRSPATSFFQGLEELQQIYSVDEQHQFLDGQWYSWKKISPIPDRDLNYTVSIDAQLPVDAQNVCVFVLAYKMTSGSQYNEFGSIRCTPIGDTRQVWDSLRTNQVIIGDDSGDDDEGSGLKGIIKFIKNLPSWIFNKLIDLLVPDLLNFDFSSVFDSLEEHLGALTQVDDLYRAIIVPFLSWQPYSGTDISQYDLKFPSFSVWIDTEGYEDQQGVYHPGFYIDSEDNGGSEFVLIPDQGDGYYHLDLSFFEDHPAAETFYGIYRGFVVVFIILAVLGYARTVFDHTFY